MFLVKVEMKRFVFNLIIIFSYAKTFHTAYYVGGPRYNKVL